MLFSFWEYTLKNQKQEFLTDICTPVFKAVLYTTAKK